MTASECDIEKICYVFDRVNRMHLFGKCNWLLLDINGLNHTVIKNSFNCKHNFNGKWNLVLQVYLYVLMYVAQFGNVLDLFSCRRCIL